MSTGTPQTFQDRPDPVPLEGGAADATIGSAFLTAYAARD